VQGGGRSGDQPRVGIAGVTLHKTRPVKDTHRQSADGDVCVLSPGSGPLLRADLALHAPPPAAASPLL